MTSAPRNDKVSSTIFADAPAPDRATRIDDLEAAKAVDAVRDVEKEEDKTAGAQEEWLESPEHPWNWPLSTKWLNTTVIAVTGFLSTLDSSIFVPAMPILENRYRSSREVITLTTSLYVAGLGCGPFVMAPIAELYGRQRAYSISMIGFSIMNLVCCFVDSLPGLIVLRFLSGFFGSSGPGLGVATISDLFRPQERGRPIAIYAIGPMLGPVLGSILGNWLVLLDFRWPFRLMTILIGLNTLAVLFLMRETYAPVLERAFLARRSGREKADAPSRSLAKAVVIRTFSRPPRMLFNPVCALFATYYAYTYGIIYVFIVSLPLLFAKHDPPTGIFTYGWPAGTAGLCYIGLGIGFLSSAATAALFQDRIYQYLSRKYKNQGVPEYRLVVTQIGMIFFPIGLLIFGWTAQAQTHWIGPMIGSVVFSYGLMMTFNSIQNFIVDAFVPYSAAAMAAATLLRSSTGAILPIFSPQLFINLNYGLGATLLACVSLPAVPAPLILFMMGEKLRDRWRFKA
ncbi:MFS polyamine transporter [Rhodotorula toruloides]|uniref:MFS polyamine transporter n=1 Tax=Rhodotorula toruloides TaxID=5286 RepID=A0A511KP64_RHOTO|nr:MFS polyamine transporter [Rhodotorula toruloides]